MYVYVIEKGSMIGTQKGMIHNIFKTEANAKNEMWRLRQERTDSGMVVTDGVSEFDTEPGILDGFWWGPKGGNTCSGGYRLQKVRAW